MAMIMIMNQYFFLLLFSILIVSTTSSQGSSTGYGTFEVTTSPSANWYSITTDDTGQYLLASAAHGGIYWSTNYGWTWNITGAIVGLNWRGVCSNANFSLVFAVKSDAASNGVIYRSTSNAQTWSLTTAGNAYWNSVTTSASGKYVAAVSLAGANVVSSNYGVTWIATNLNVITYWISVTSSKTGQYVACASSLTNGYIYISNLYGFGTWTITSASAGASSTWAQLAMDSSGQYIYAAVKGGFLYKNSNYGSGSFTALSGSTFQQWQCLACDQTGTFLAAGIFGGGIFASSDAGQTWQATLAPNNQWYSIALSGPAQYLTSVNYGGYIYRTQTALPTSQPSMQPSSQPSTPSSQPSSHPSSPSSHPSSQPSGKPSSQPFSHPSSHPSDHPTPEPTISPTYLPGKPTPVPTSTQPTFQPTLHPSIQPSMQPTYLPGNPTPIPTYPEGSPTPEPSMSSSQPTSNPAPALALDPKVIAAVVIAVAATLIIISGIGIYYKVNKRRLALLAWEKWEVVYGNNPPPTSSVVNPITDVETTHHIDVTVDNFFKVDNRESIVEMSSLQVSDNQNPLHNNIDIKENTIIPPKPTIQNPKKNALLVQFKKKIQT